MLVSICVPIYNVENFIARCARSLFEQTYPNLEYIFVNDCTKDRSMDILSEVINDYPLRLSSIKVVSHENNRGLSASRNSAIANCSGDFVMHVDSDDYLEKNAVELLVKKQIETGADIVSGNAIKETKEGQLLLNEPDYKDKEEMLLHYFQPTIDHVIWRRLIRLSLYKDFRIQAKEGVNIGEDWQVLPKLVYHADKIAKIDNIIYHYNCMNEDSSMSRKNKRFDRFIADQDLRSIEILQDFFEDKDEKYKQKLLWCKAAMLDSYLSKAFLSKDAYYYNIIADSILSLDKKYLAHIGWDKFKIRFINRNYLMRRIFNFVFSCNY